MENLNLSLARQQISAPPPPLPKKSVENFKPAIGLSPLEVGEYLRSPKVQQNCPPVFLGGGEDSIRRRIMYSKIEFLKRYMMMTAWV